MAGRLDLGFRDELIEQYFKLGYNHAEILLCLLLLHDRELECRWFRTTTIKVAEHSLHAL